MNRVLIVAQHDGDQLASATAKTLQCGRAIPDAQISIVVFADQGNLLAAQAAKLEGIYEVIVVNDVAHAHPLAAVIAPQLAELAVEYTHVFAPATTFGKDLLPRAAALIGAVQLSDIFEVASATVFRRFIHAGNALETVEVNAAVIFGTVRVASFVAANSAEKSVLVREYVPKVSSTSHTRFVSISGKSADRPDLQSAKYVVAGGRAFASAENFKQIYELANLLGAAVGASRAAVDSGFVPNELQVGQTGKTIAPQLYIAIGISGAIQHVAGIKDSKTIVAINMDADAPIFEIADIGLVADLFDVLPELKRAFK